MSPSGGISEIDQLLEALEELEQSLDGLGDRRSDLPPVDRDLAHWRKRLERQGVHAQQNYTIMLLGSFNTGKTTLLNALIGLPQELRMKSADEPTTALPVRLSQRRPGDPEARLIKTSGETDDSSWEKALSLSSTSSPGAGPGKIREVRLFLDHPLLQHADFLDMPGTGSSWQQVHTALVHETIEQAELIVWVIGATQPDRRALADLNVVRESQSPVIAVFNAWGSLISDRYNLDASDQNALEAAARESYPWVFESHDGFRIYTRKCLETLDRESDPLTDPELGLVSFRDFLAEQYLSQFVNLAHLRRSNVALQVQLIAEKALRESRNWLEDWRRELTDLGEDKRALIEERRSVGSLEDRIQSQIAKHSRTRVENIIHHIREQAEVFIDNKLRLTNMESLKMALGLSGREEIERRLYQEFSENYLKLNRSNNWLKQEVGEFMQVCWTRIHAEWDRYLIELEVRQTTSTWSPEPPDLPFDQIREAAVAGVADVVARLLGAGALLTILLLIPGGEVVDVVIFALYALVATFRDPLAKPRENAKRRLRSELDQQRAGLRAELTRHVMEGPQKDLREAFLSRAQSQYDRLTAAERTLLAGQEALERFVGVFDTVLGVSRDERSTLADTRDS